MALPKNIYDIIDPPQSLLPAEWPNIFCEYKWFYLAGLGRTVNSTVRVPRAHPLPLQKAIPLFHKHKKAIRVNGFLRDAANYVPNDWKNHKDFADLEWDTPPSVEQVFNAVQGEALVFERACLVLGVLQKVLEEEGMRSFQVQEHVRIRPAFFRVGGFSKPFFLKHLLPDAKRYAELRQKTGQHLPVFFEDLIKGYSATYPTLDTLRGTCTALGCVITPPDDAIFPIAHRTHRYRKDIPKKPSLSPRPADGEHHYGP